MDRDGSLDARYSFNCSIGNHPAAESTKLNQTTNNSFRWGSSSICGRQRSNSSTNLINWESCAEDGLLERSRCKNSRKFDPRIVADVQSKGLASRIVKYHENGNRLHRSMSAHNLYNKPGQFPVVTLKKTDLPYRATKQNVSMTRIAPPEKSVFCGSTLSSLLRSNSVMGLQKSDEDISRENRPILHPPPTENDMAPTRSVLDVLKEISRKRINSDDPNSDDTSKKNRTAGNDILDAGNSYAANTSMMAQSSKRQRDINCHYKGETNLSSKCQETNKSPEQAKKRVCSYNNDITSSLSSSAKRKPYDKKRSSYHLNHTMPDYLESYEAQQVKVKKCNGSDMSNDNRSDHLASKLNNANGEKSMTSMPNTMPMSHQIPYGIVPQRSKSEPLYTHEKFETAMKYAQSSNKPRLTLFNKEYDASNEAIPNDSESNDNLDENSDCAGINFVKPKKLTTTGVKNPIIERTQKSKLALMLSGLRGELYLGSDNDELDSPKKQELLKDTGPIPIEPLEKDKCISSNNVTNNENASLHSNSTYLKKQSDNVSGTSSSAKTTQKNASPLVGIKLTPKISNANSDSAQKTDGNQQISAHLLGKFPCNNTPNLVVPGAEMNASKHTPSVGGTVTTSVSFGAPNQAPDISDESTKFSFGSTGAEPTNKKNPQSAITTNTTTSHKESFTFGCSNTTNTSVHNNSITSTGIANSISTSNTFCNTETNVASKIVPSATTNNKTAFPNTFVLQASAMTTPVPILELKPTIKSVTTAPFSFGLSSNSHSITSNSKDKPSGNFSFIPANTSASNMLLPSVTTTVSAPLTNTFNFGISSSKDVPIFNTQTSSATPLSGSTNGVASFNRPSTNTNTTSNPFTASNASVQPVFAMSSNKNTATVFGSDSSKSTSSMFGGSPMGNTAMTSILSAKTSADKGSAVVNNTNTTTTSVGFAFGTEATKPIANGSFTFGSLGNNTINTKTTDSSAPTSAVQSNTFTFSSGTNAGDKKSSTNMFGGSITSTPTENTTNPVGFSFGSNTGAGDIKKSSPTFSFGSTNILPSPAAGFSFAGVASTKPNDTATAAPSNKPFSFGTPNSQNLASSNNNQTSLNMFAAPTLAKASTPTFNFGATPAPNTQLTATQNTNNNVFALPAGIASSGTNDRPIRRATRRLQK